MPYWKCRISRKRNNGSGPKLSPGMSAKRWGFLGRIALRADAPLAQADREVLVDLLLACQETATRGEEELVQPLDLRVPAFPDALIQAVEHLGGHGDELFVLLDRILRQEQQCQTIFVVRKEELAKCFGCFLGRCDFFVVTMGKP